MFLPVNRNDMNKRGWDQVDFVLVTGDAYVDHPSFGTAIISRVLEAYGYKVAILAQPDWKSCDDFRRFGKPRLGFLIKSGNVDSMVNNFSVFRHRRKTDLYSPGGKAGRRPDRAMTVYCNRAREAYKDVPVIIGGLEASLRRMGHYDYWSDKVRRSVLIDSRADVLIYGMGERASVQIAEALDAGIDVKDIKWIKGTCVKGRREDLDDETVVLPDFSEIKEDKDAYAKSFALQYRNNDQINGKRLAEPYDKDLFVIQNIPQKILTRSEMDQVYELPYERNYHPSYEKDGGVPAIKEVKFSITGTRGCFGGCSFCALTYHQGREVVSRSRESIEREAKMLTEDQDFKGYIHDIGGPTANFRKPACRKQKTKGVCRDRDCMYPEPCPAVEADHSEYLKILKEVRQLPGVKKVFIRSGIRYDYLMADSRWQTFLEQLCLHHVSGTLKVAPEHASPYVLAKMRKPQISVFERFSREYEKMNRKLKKKQYLIPYMISSHPGSSLDDAVQLALFLKKTGFIPDQVQDFYPTPGTLATCMYYTGKDPLTGDEVYVARDMEEKKMQRALMHFHKKENRDMVRKALIKAGRKDLIDILLKTGGGRRGHHR